MPLIPSFSISQTPLNPAIIVFTDTSSGSDGSISVRHIYIQDAAGNFVVPKGTTTDFIVWPIANISLAVSVLDTDIAANIRVVWLNGTTIEYDSNANYCFAEYNKQFFYYLWQLQSLKPGVLQDANYTSNITLYWSNIIGAIQSVEIGNDIASSQNALNQANLMRSQQAKYF